MIKELLTAATCCVGVVTMSTYNLPSQCDCDNDKYYIESKIFDLSNISQTYTLNIDNFIKENIQISNEYTVKKLEDIFGKMTGFTQEENEYFWNRIKEKSTVIEGIEII